MCERKPLWKWVIVGKYGQQEGGWCSKEAREGHGVRLWKTIKSVCKALKEKIGFKVGLVTR